MADEYWQGQVVKVTAKLTDPASATAPVDATTGETLTADASETMIAYRPDGSASAVAAPANPSTGIYTGQVTADQVGFWQVNDAKGGVYEFYVKPIKST